MFSLPYRLAETHVAAVLDVQLEAVTDRQPPTPAPCPRLLVPASLPGPGGRHGDEPLADNPGPEPHPVQGHGERDGHEAQEAGGGGQGQDQCSGAGVLLLPGVGGWAGGGDDLAPVPMMTQLTQALGVSFQEDALAVIETEVVTRVSLASVSGSALVTGASSGVILGEEAGAVNTKVGAVAVSREDQGLIVNGSDGGDLLGVQCHSVWGHGNAGDCVNVDILTGSFSVGEGDNPVRFGRLERFDKLQVTVPVLPRPPDGVTCPVAPVDPVLVHSDGEGVMVAHLADQLPVASVRVRPGDGEPPPPNVGPVELPLEAVEGHRPGPRQVGRHH